VLQNRPTSSCCIYIYVYVYVYIYIHIYLHIYIYIYIEREREIIVTLTPPLLYSFFRCAVLQNRPTSSHTALPFDWRRSSPYPQRSTQLATSRSSYASIERTASCRASSLRWYPPRSRTNIYIYICTYLYSASPAHARTCA